MNWPGVTAVTSTNLEVSALGLEPVVDKALRISGKTQHELSLGLQLVDGLNSLMDLCWRWKIKEKSYHPTLGLFMQLTSENNKSFSK